MSKLRISYSLLNLWSKGQQEEAVQNYLHIEREKTPQQLHGIDTHKEWQNKIMKNKKITLGNKEYVFTNPQCEYEVIADYNDRWLVKGYIDTVDFLPDNFVNAQEYKTGGTSSAQYSNTMQIPFYFMLLTMIGFKPRKAEVIHEDADKKIDSALVWFWDEFVKDAQNYVDSLAPEIESYFITNSIPL